MCTYETVNVVENEIERSLHAAFACAKGFAACRANHSAALGKNERKKTLEGRRGMRRGRSY